MCALEAGLNLGRVTLETLSNDLASKARTSANLLSDTPDTTAALVLERVRADPAVASGTFVTTITDVVGFFSFLGIATLWFGLR